MSPANLFSRLPVQNFGILTLGMSSVILFTRWIGVRTSKTFNGFGNAIEYLGRYTHRIAITNTRIQSVTDTHVSFAARDYKSGETKTVTLENKEFIRRFLMHVLPSGFQKIRYYGFLNNRTKSESLRIIFKLQGYQKFKQRYTGLSVAELLKEVWNYDIHICPACGCSSMTYLGRSYTYRN
mgnify:CR=1 FL=1